MSTTKVYYFPGRARAENIRMLLHLAGEPFEDVRFYEDTEAWKSFKKTLGYGQLPILDYEGERYNQSNAITRMLANKFGYAGKTPKEAARCDMIVDCADELYVQEFLWNPNPNPPIPLCTPEERAIRIKNYEENVLPKYLTNLEKMLVENNGGNGWFVGDSMTWADLHVYNTLEFATQKVNPGYNPPAFNDRFSTDCAPKLKALKARIEANPKIAEWIAKRPKPDDWF